MYAVQGGHRDVELHGGSTDPAPHYVEPAPGGRVGSSQMGAIGELREANREKPVSTTITPLPSEYLIQDDTVV